MIFHFLLAPFFALLDLNELKYPHVASIFSEAVQRLDLSDYLGRSSEKDSTIGRAFSSSSTVNPTQNVDVLQIRFSLTHISNTVGFHSLRRLVVPRKTDMIRCISVRIPNDVIHIKINTL